MHVACRAPRESRQKETTDLGIAATWSSSAVHGGWHSTPRAYYVHSVLQEKIKDSPASVTWKTWGRSYVRSEVGDRTRLNAMGRILSTNHVIRESSSGAHVGAIDLDSAQGPSFSAMSSFSQDNNPSGSSWDERPRTSERGGSHPPLPLLPHCATAPRVWSALISSA